MAIRIENRNNLESSIEIVGMTNRQGIISTLINSKKSTVIC